MPVHLETPRPDHAPGFLDGVRRSRSLHQRLVSPPATLQLYRSYVQRFSRPSHIAHFVCLPAGEIAGVINLSDVVRGMFQSGYLGYYAFVPYNGQGHMSAGLRLVVARAFRAYRLHRVEANIQPENQQSIALVTRLGFRLEGVSRRYLKIAGRWRDHERWALTVEEWRAHRRADSVSGSPPCPLRGEPM